MRVNYRVFHQLADLGWVDLALGCSIILRVAQPFQPKSHLPQQNLADSGTAMIKVNRTKFRELMNTLYS